LRIVKLNSASAFMPCGQIKEAYTFIALTFNILTTICTVIWAIICTIIIKEGAHTK
jgi:hypothetical protein